MLRGMRSLTHLEMSQCISWANNEWTRLRKLYFLQEWFPIASQTFIHPLEKTDAIILWVSRGQSRCFQRQVLTFPTSLREYKPNWCAAWGEEIGQNWQVWTLFLNIEYSSREKWQQCPDMSCFPLLTAGHSMTLYTNQEDMCCCEKNWQIWFGSGNGVSWHHAGS